MLAHVRLDHDELHVACQGQEFDDYLHFARLNVGAVPRNRSGGAAAYRRVFSGSKQTAPIKTQLPLPLAVTVLDASSNPLPGVTVTFSDAGKGGSFSSVSATTDSSGHASTVYTTGSVTGIVHVSAAVTGLAPAVFTVTVTAQ